MYVPFFPVPLPVPFPFYAPNGNGSRGKGITRPAARGPETWYGARVRVSRGVVPF